MKKRINRPAENAIPISRSLLSEVNSPDDLKKLNINELRQYCDEARSFLIDSVSKTGGHLASNLGVVELTVALHRVFDVPQDKIVWDVGHQSYTHKLITGRRDRFDTLRQKDGLAGFPRQAESEYDAFIAGHSSTSISAALGYAEAMRIKGDPHHAIAVIGDGAFTGGMAYEAMNNSGNAENLIVVLNYNEMSISKNVGSFARYLAAIRSKPKYFRFKRRVEKVLDHTPLIGKRLKNALVSSKSMLKNLLYHSTFFEDFGFTFLGPVDGHDLDALDAVLSRAKEIKGPVLIHVDTIKGKGYTFAEQNPGAFHGISKFDVETGNPDVAACDSFSTVAGKHLKALADEDERICAITAAMKYGTGLQYFSGAHRDRFFDVGIAEQHAVTFAASLAAGGLTPVFAVYSTFLQRGYDQVIHDAAIEKTHIVLAVDRAGIVGEDGETHQGVFDVAFLSSIPNVTVYSPSNYRELTLALDRAIYETEGVVAVRYPRGSDRSGGRPDLLALPDDELFDDQQARILLISYGRTALHALEAQRILAQRGIKAAVLKLNKIAPLCDHTIRTARRYAQIHFFEEGVRKGSIAEHLLSALHESGYTGKYQITAIEEGFVAQANVSDAMRKYHLDAQSMAAQVMASIENTN